MSLIKTLSLATLAAATSFSLIGCGDDGGGGGGGGNGDEVDPAGTHTQYVVSELVIPESTGAAQAVALDLDDDGIPDNALGGLLASLASQSNGALNLQAGVNEELAAGSFILLASLKATDLTNASGVGLYVFFGNNANPPPCTDPGDPATCGQHLQGNATFGISPDSPDDASLVGQLAGGELSAGPGSVAIQVPLGDIGALDLDLIGARVSVDVSATGLMSGRLAGAIPNEQVQNEIIPTVHNFIVDVIEGDCTGEGEDCGCGDSTGATILGFLDENGDCQVPLEELTNNPLIKSTLEPDLDLLDANGNFDPGADDEVDSLSIAVGFSAVNGGFDLPAGIE